MGNCKDCKHWESPEKIEIYSYEAGYELSKTMGVCVLTSMGGGIYEHPESLALAVDAEDYSARLMTEPNFGCVQFEVKPHA